MLFVFIAGNLTYSQFIEHYVVMVYQEILFHKE